MYIGQRQVENERSEAYYVAKNLPPVAYGGATDEQIKQAAQEAGVKESLVKEMYSKAQPTVYVSTQQAVLLGNTPYQKGSPEVKAVEAVLSGQANAGEVIKASRALNISAGSLAKLQTGEAKAEDIMRISKATGISEKSIVAQQENAKINDVIKKVESGTATAGDVVMASRATGISQGALARFQTGELRPQDIDELKKKAGYAEKEVVQNELWISGGNSRWSDSTSNLSDRNIRSGPLVISENTQQNRWWDIPSKLRDIQSRAEYTSARTGAESPAFLNIISFTSGVGAAITQPVFHPIATIKGTFNMVIHPKQTMYKIGEELKTRPSGFAGELVGGLILGKGIAKVAPTPKATIQTTGENLAIRPTESGFVTVVESASKAKVGSKTYDIVAGGKEIAIQGKNAEAIYGKYAFETEGAQAKQLVRGARIQTEQGTQTIADYFTKIQTTKGTKAQAGAIKTISQNILEDEFGLRTEAALSVSKGSKAVSVPSEATFAQIVEKTARQKPQSISATITKETAKIDDVSYAKGKTVELRGDKALDIFSKNIQKIKEEQAKDIYGSSQRAQQLTRSSSVLSQLQMGVKQLAAQKYKEEVIEPSVQATFNLASVKDTLKTEVTQEKAIQKTKEKVNTDAEQTTQQRIKIDIVSVQKANQELILSQLNRTSLIQQTKPAQIQTTEQASSLDTGLLPDVEVVQLQTQKQTPEIRQMQRTNLLFGLTQIPQSRTLQTELPQSLPLISPRLEIKKRKSILYKVMVRRGGIFRQVAVKSSPQEAIRFGKATVSSTAAASFKVVPTEGKMDLKAIAQELSPMQFYESKKEAGVFIERPEKRIKSVGEKREITQKGLEAIRIKKVF